MQSAGLKNYTVQQTEWQPVSDAICQRGSPPPTVHQGCVTAGCMVKQQYSVEYTRTTECSKVHGVSLLHRLIVTLVQATYYLKTPMSKRCVNMWKRKRSFLPRHTQNDSES